MQRHRPTTVDEYIAAAPEQAQAKLRELRALLKAAAPSAKEAIKWGNPVLEGKRILFSYSAHKSHLNFMPTRSTIEPFKDELKEYKTGQDTVQLPYDQPLPKKLIQDMSAYRIKEVEAGSLWMHNDKK